MSAKEEAVRDMHTIFTVKMEQTFGNRKSDKKGKASKLLMEKGQYCTVCRYARDAEYQLLFLIDNDRVAVSFRRRRRNTVRRPDGSLPVPPHSVVTAALTTPSTPHDALSSTSLKTICAYLRRFSKRGWRLRRQPGSNLRRQALCT